MFDFKIIIESEDHSRFIQEQFFKFGYSWSRGVKKAINTREKYLYFRSNYTVRFGTEESTFLSMKAVEIKCGSYEKQKLNLSNYRRLLKNTILNNRDRSKSHKVVFLTKGSEARTLSHLYIGDNKSGWIIQGDIEEDYYKWVNSFEAYHPKYGKIWGDFETTVFADSEEAYNQFLEHHPYDEWDYQDI